MLLIFAISAAFALGYSGYLLHFQSVSPEVTYLDITYRTFGLFIYDSDTKVGPLPMKIACCLVPATLTYAAVETILDIISSHGSHFRIRFLKGHGIICGLNQNSLTSIESIIRMGVDAVVIEPEMHNQLLSQVITLGCRLIAGSPINYTQRY